MKSHPNPTSHRRDRNARISTDEAWLLVLYRAAENDRARQVVAVSAFSSFRDPLDGDRAARNRRFARQRARLRLTARALPRLRALSPAEFLGGAR